jgi:hypothetical protein
MGRDLAERKRPGAVVEPVVRHAAVRMLACAVAQRTCQAGSLDWPDKATNRAAPQECDAAISRNH